MANWAAYKESEIGLPVVKRAKHGLHFKRPDGLIQAEFVGKPCHYFDGKEYKPIDTKPLLRKDGSYGCPHSDVVILPDGTVQVGEYYQKAALIYPGKIGVDGDRIARPFSGGVQYLYITENGFRQEIVLEKMPDLKKVSALVDTVSGVLPTKYTASSLSLRDSSTAELSDFVQVDSKSLASVLEAAKYPVVIDPDFAGESESVAINGSNSSTWENSRSTSSAAGTFGSGYKYLGYIYSSPNYTIYRNYHKFDTSSIGSGSTVTQVNLKMTSVNVYSSYDYDILIVKYDWSTFGADITNATNRETAYDALLTANLDDSIWVNRTSLSVRTPTTSGNLNTAWVNKTGITYYGIIEEFDRNNEEPSEQHLNRMAGAGYTDESYRPVLTVTYTAAAAGNPYYYYMQLGGK